jgi:hypothetical protein
MASLHWGGNTQRWKQRNREPPTHPPAPGGASWGGLPCGQQSAGGAPGAPPPRAQCPPGPPQHHAARRQKDGKSRRVGWQMWRRAEVRWQGPLFGPISQQGSSAQGLLRRCGIKAVAGLACASAMTASRLAPTTAQCSAVAPISSAAGGDRQGGHTYRRQPVWAACLYVCTSGFAFFPLFHRVTVPPGITNTAHSHLHNFTPLHSPRLTVAP